MKFFLIVIMVLTLIVGGTIDGLAETILEQIYATMFYIMALMAFCTFVIKTKESVNCICNKNSFEKNIDK